MNYPLEQQKQSVTALAFKAEKLALFPTDTVWSVGCLLTSSSARQTMHQLAAGRSFTPEILFSSLRALKEWVPDLHPRLETLLYVHQRPLTLVLDQAPKLCASAHLKTPIAVRIVQDDYCRLLLAQTEEPVYSMPAFTAHQGIATHFGQISSDILSQVDYVDKYRQADTYPGSLSVMARLNAQEELEFLRD